MVNLGFGGNESVRCEGCGTEIPAFLDDCPYCAGQDEFEATLPCPSCGTEIHEDSQQCPVCSAWVTMKVPGKQGTGRGLIIGLVVLLILAILLLAAR